MKIFFRITVEYSSREFQVNEDRIKEMFARNYKNHIAFSVLGVLVVKNLIAPRKNRNLIQIGIYFYTMYAVKQETFLEEIDQEVAAEKPISHGHLAPSK